MKAEFELLTTKDSNNVLQFPNENYFINTKTGYLKSKYAKAIQKLNSQNLVRLSGNFNYLTNSWEFNWVCTM